MAEKTRYTSDELVEFGKLLLEKKKKAEETLNAGQSSDLALLERPKNHIDQAQESQTFAVDAISTERQIKYLSDIESALRRIKAGTYGVCAVTGNLIPRERLLANPITTRCIEAKVVAA